MRRQVDAVISVNLSPFSPESASACHSLPFAKTVQSPPWDWDSGIWPICDLFVGPRSVPANTKRIRDIDEHVAQHRVLKWEDEVQHLVNSGDLSIADLKELEIKPAMLARFAKQMGQHVAAVSTTHQPSGFGT